MTRSQAELSKRRLPPRVQAAMAVVASEHGMTISMAVSAVRGCQSPLFVRCRAEMAVELRRIGISLPMIGVYLGGLHHTSVLHLIRTYGPEAEKKRQAALDIPCPDLSGEWAI